MQKNYYIILLLVFSSLKHFSLELKLDQKSFRSEKLNFRIDSFIDGRTDVLLPVGFTKIGLKNEHEFLTVPSGFATYCQSFFLASALKFSDQVNLVAVVRMLTVQELVVQGNEYSDCSVSIDYYQYDQKLAKFNLFYQSYHKTVAGPLIDATGKHAKNLSETFLASFLELSEFIAAGSQKTTEKAEVKQTQLKVLTLEFPGDTLLKDGLYYSPAHLLSNRPAEFAKFATQIDTSRLEQHLIGEMFLPYSPCYAFVENGVLYISVRKNIYHKSRMIFANKKLRVLDIQNKKSSLKEISSFPRFGLVGDLITLLLPGVKEKDNIILVDLTTGLFME